jgi:hypothetical protein
MSHTATRFRVHRLQADRLSRSLPKCFPVGAKYVIEARAGGEREELHVLSRYVELPGGRRINVPADLNRSPSPRALSARRLAAKPPLKQGKAAMKAGTAAGGGAGKLAGARKFAARAGTP